MKPILLASLLAAGCIDSALPETDTLDNQNHDLDTSAVGEVHVPQTKQLQTGGMDQGTVVGVKIDFSKQSGIDVSTVDGVKLKLDPKQSGMDLSSIAGIALQLDSKQVSGFDFSSVTVTDLKSFDNRSGISYGSVDWAPLSQNWHAGTTSFGGRNCIVKSDATVWCWGYNGDGGLGNGEVGGTHINPVQVKGLDNVVSIALTDDAACALRRDGAIWCWGNNKHGEVGGVNLTATLPVSALGLPNATSIAAGKDYFCANDGASSFCWGGAIGSVPATALVHQFDDHSALAYFRGDQLVVKSVSLLK